MLESKSPRDRVLCTNLWMALTCSNTKNRTVCVVCRNRESIPRIQAEFKIFVRDHGKFELENLLSHKSYKRMIFYNGWDIIFVSRDTLMSGLRSTSFHMVIFEEGIEQQLTPLEQTIIAVCKII